MAVRTAAAPKTAQKAQRELEDLQLVLKARNGHQEALDALMRRYTGFDICALLDSRNGSAPAVILVSSRDASDYGDLIAASCARGFVPKAELSGEAVAALLA